ncbi:MAG: phosphatase PAP2 family protein [Chloroflexi bacterium]|nr:phosphatase PAP2 family protein [Chloroflexota bacterium]
MLRLERTGLVTLKQWAPYGAFALAFAYSLPAFFLERFPGDLGIAVAVGSARHSPLTEFMEVVSFVGKGWPMIALAGVIAACFFLLRVPRACVAVLGGLVAMGINPLFKLIIQRPRPPAELVNATDTFGGLGFPSGHAFQAVILFGVLAFLASDLIKDLALRRLVQGALVALVFAIGISRVYLGAHWASDVLGGYLWGAAFLLLLFRLYRRRWQPVSAV